MNKIDPVKEIHLDSDVAQSLYAKRKKIHPREVHGIFAQLRVAAVFALLGLFYGLPWLQWDGRQAVLLDLPARKFHIFGLTLWPQDFLLLTLLLIIAGLSLFFFTTLAGRLWCGYACPQTVWTEVFLTIERWVEGDRAKQIKLDKAPMSVKKFRIKATKHTAWILFSAFTGFTFVAYFTSLRDLAANLTVFSLGPWETFWIIFYGFATYGNAGWMREQVCLHMCPYARFQSAMFDSDTLIISYNQDRGEPRGARKRSDDHKELGLGDCIGCTMCVQVCPTGIDIRDGLQYECIGCSACIDVCNDVMNKVGYEKDLIAYTTQNSVDGKPSKIIRPRIIIYALILAGLIGTLTYLLATRVPLQLDIIRDRNALFRETNEGLIENVYTLKLINMDDYAHDFTLTTRGLNGLELIIEHENIFVKGGNVVDLPVRLRVDETDLKQHSSTIYFNLTAKDNPELNVTEEGRFLGPRK